MFRFWEKNEKQKPIIRKSIPVLIVNNAWHNLFANKKPNHIKSIEKRLENLVKKYSQVKQDLKDCNKLKKQLMNGIISDMDHISDEIPFKLDKKMQTNSKLIQDLNQRIEENEDLLLELPHQIDECNKDLVLETAEIFYKKLIQNTEEHQQKITEINKLKQQLRDEVNRKIDLEEENAFIYKHLHQVMGAENIDQFDEFFIGQQSMKKPYDLKSSNLAGDTLETKEKE